MIDALNGHGLPTSKRWEGQVSMVGSAPPRKRPRRVWKKLQGRGFAAHYGGTPVPRCQVWTECVYFDAEAELRKQHASRGRFNITSMSPIVVFPQDGRPRYASDDEAKNLITSGSLHIVDLEVHGEESGRTAHIKQLDGKMFKIEDRIMFDGWWCPATLTMIVAKERGGLVPEEVITGAHRALHAASIQIAAGLPERRTHRVIARHASYGNLALEGSP